MTRFITVKLGDNETPVTDAVVVLADATGTFGVRVAETDEVVVAAGTPMPYDATRKVYSYAFTTAQPGVAYESTVFVTWPDGSVDFVDRPLAAEGSGGRYWSVQGCTTHLGTKSLAVYSNLGDEDRDLKMDQVIADGTKADDYVDFRAANGSKHNNWVVPIQSTAAYFNLVREVADLYTCWLLVSHKIEADEQAGTTSDITARTAVGLRRRCEMLADQIFGPVQDTELGGFQTIPLDRDTDATPFACWNW